MHRDVGYARISKDDLLSGKGVSRQEEDVRATSERTGGQLVEMLVDNDMSASRYARKKRKNYPRIPELIRAGAIDRVIVYDLDRLLRLPSELEELIDLVEDRNGFPVINVTGSLDLTTADGRFIARILVAKAAKESDDISRRTMRANDAIAAAGGILTRKRAFGYACRGRHFPEDCPGGDCENHCDLPDCKHDGISVVPYEADLIRQAAADVLAGESISGIAKRWNALGVKTAQRGKAWGPTTVRVVLTGARQAGLVRHRDEIVGTGTWPAIIDRDTHERLKAVIADRGHDQPRRRGEFTSLFKTIDGFTLASTTSRKRGKVYRHYRFVSMPGREGHNTSVAAQPLEDLVRGWLWDAADDGSLARRRLARRQRTVQPVGEDPAELERRLVELAEDEAEDRITRAEWLAKRERLTKRLEAAQASVRRSTVDDVLDEVTPGLRDRWPGVSVDRRRAILLAVFERVIIRPAKKPGPVFDPDRVEPIWRE